MIEINVDTSEFDQQMKEAKLALERLGIAVGESLLPVFNDVSVEFAKIGTAYLEGFVEGIVIYRLPLWFVYFVFGLLLVVITLILGV